MVAPATQRPFFKRILTSLVRTPVADDDEARRVIALCHALMSESGEVSGIRIASEVLARYRALAPTGREHFFSLLADDFLPDRDRLGRAAAEYSRNPSQATMMQLQAAVEPPRQELFRRLNVAPGSTAQLVDLRRELLKTLANHPEWAGLDADMAHLFRSWFNGGFLTLQRIDWHTSAVVLERLIRYESVHQIRGWGDLQRRLADDRRCYAFFHPALPDEPLIFLEIALTRRMSAAVQPLIDPNSPVVDPGTARCAVFYSITNCQEGLRGVAFGNLLIKEVVEDLRRTVPLVRTFATLSPVPGFRKWLESDATAGGRKSAALSACLARDASLPSPDISTGLRDEVLKLAAQYLLRAKQGKAPLDSVARFHLANGARLERMNWMGDTSEAGMLRSLGLMVNYVYRLGDLEKNHEAYASDYRIVASRDIERLVKVGRSSSRTTVLAAVALAASLAVGCGPASLTMTQAQTAVTEWVDGPGGPSSTGQARVTAIHPGTDANQLAVELRVTHFPDEDGHTSPEEDPAEAVFVRDGNGPWVLKQVTWDSGRRTASPGIVVR